MTGYGAGNTVLGGSKRLELGRLIGSGGEGSVYELGNDRVAKIYTTAPDGGQRDKLSALIAARNDDLMRIAAWPDMLLRDRSGAVVGFAMPKIADRVPLHRLFAPGIRKSIAPDRHWGFLAHVARNVAAAVGVVHAAGALVGDLNDRNTLVSLGTGEISLIDVDSFQISVDGVTYPSTVGVDLYLAPELQGAMLADIVRTRDHDTFALAVVIFRLLMMGRHPYGGVNLPPGVDDTDLAKIMRRLPYAYGERAEALGIRRPPQSIQLSSLTTEVSVLFEQAFERGDSRPTAEFWVRALERFEADLAECRVAPLHRFIRSSGPCPWCALERDGYVAFLGPVASGKLPPYDSLEDRRWLASLSVPMAPPVTVLQPVIRLPAPHASWLGWGVWYTAAATAGVSDISLVVTHAWTLAIVAVFAVSLRVLRWQLPPRRRVRRIARLRTRLDVAEASWKHVVEAWRSPASQMQADRALDQFRTLLDLLERPGADLTRRMNALEKHKRNILLEEYLARFAIADSKLFGINVRVRANLFEYGIVTASDVRKLTTLKVPDVGPGRRLALFNWREKLALRFAYDPARPLPPSEIARVEREHADACREAMQRLPILRNSAMGLLRRVDEERAAAELGLARAARELGRVRQKLAVLGESYNS